MIFECKCDIKGFHHFLLVFALINIPLGFVRGGGYKNLGQALSFCTSLAYHGVCVSVQIPQGNENL